MALPPEPANWISGNFVPSQSQMDQNAIKFAYEMARLGVSSYNAILGMLANIDDESYINPGIWESLDPFGGGYGLVQWTPYTKYSEWAGSGWQDNGLKECERIIYEAENGLQWFGNPYAYLIGKPTNPPISLLEYLSDETTSPYDLADYWLLYYEHPAEIHLQSRHESNILNVQHYNEVLGGEIPPVGGRFKWWLSKYQLQRRRENVD